MVLYVFRYWASKDVVNLPGIFQMVRCALMTYHKGNILLCDQLMSAAELNQTVPESLSIIIFLAFVVWISATANSRNVNDK